jgi:CRP-like cAMP-binding protein
MDIDFEWLENQIFHRKLNEVEKSGLDQTIRIIEFHKHDVMATEGESCDGLYLLYSGRASVYYTSHGVQVRVGEAIEGAQLGDMAFFDGQPYSTTITARVDCVAYKISREDLENVLAYHHEMAKDIMLNTICRLSGIVRGMNSVNAYSQQYIQGRRV